MDINPVVPDLVVDSLVLTQDITIEYDVDPPLNVSATSSLVETSPGEYELTLDIAFNTFTPLAPIPAIGNAEFDYSELNGNQVDDQSFSFIDNIRAPVTLTRPSAIPVTITTDV